MAAVTITVTPLVGRNGSPHFWQTDDGTRYAAVKLSIAAGQTYTTADKCVLVHSAGSDFFSHFGEIVVKQVLAENFACNNVSFGAFKLYWDFSAQTGRLRKIGNGGSTAPTGPADEANVANATALGAGTMSANALIFW